MLAGQTLERVLGEINELAQNRFEILISKLNVYETTNKTCRRPIHLSRFTCK
jgi:hypothetical protein